jgi:hypothetical protein
MEILLLLSESVRAAEGSDICIWDDAKKPKQGSQRTRIHENKMRQPKEYGAEDSPTKAVLSSKRTFRFLNITLSIPFVM